MPYTPANASVVTVSAPGIYTLTATNSYSCNTIVQVTVVNCISGIEQNLISNNAISVFPNPFTDELHIEVAGQRKNYALDIYSALGVLVKKQTITEERTVINLKNEPAGIYFVYVLDGQNAIKAAKIVKN